MVVAVAGHHEDAAPAAVRGAVPAGGGDGGAAQGRHRRHHRGSAQPPGVQPAAVLVEEEVPLSAVEGFRVARRGNACCLCVLGFYCCSCWAERSRWLRPCTLGGGWDLTGRDCGNQRHALAQGCCTGSAAVLQPAWTKHSRTVCAVLWGHRDSRRFVWAIDGWSEKRRQKAVRSPHFGLAGSQRTWSLSYTSDKAGFHLTCVGAAFQPPPPPLASADLQTCWHVQAVVHLVCHCCVGAALLHRPLSSAAVAQGSAAVLPGLAVVAVALAQAAGSSDAKRVRHNVTSNLVPELGPPDSFLA